MQARMEKIGNVVLDYTYYEGQDFYTDGEIEDEMLDIAMNNPPERFPEIIEERKSWPIFYHFSPLRSNIIDWLPFKRQIKFLRSVQAAAQSQARLQGGRAVSPVWIYRESAAW